MADGPLDIEVDALFDHMGTEDLPRLRGVAFVVKQLHREDKLYLSVSDEDHPDVCPHDPEQDWDAHFEGDDGIWYCTSRPAGSECRCGKEWPCEEYAAVLGALTARDRSAILAALTGEGADGGQAAS
jgi:hypothetical protein